MDREKFTESFKRIQGQFPFPDYIREDRSRTYYEISRTVSRYLTPGSTLLDFGSGPCDITAFLQSCGIKCSAFDDLSDPWHRIGNNRDKIMSFAKSQGIDFRLTDGSRLDLPTEHFNAVILTDVLEHLHDSPRDLLNSLLASIKAGGYLFITVPNLVNIRKRISVLSGRTNLSDYHYFYWSPGNWRGHIREYTKGDLLSLAEFLSLEVLELRGTDFMLSRLPSLLRLPFVLLTNLCPGLKDTWLLAARKPVGWAPKKSLPENEIKELRSMGTTYTD